ncbi:hypothetical protein BH09MYX1_BH09MYX1_29580 [soil metagenome]
MATAKKKSTPKKTTAAKKTTPKKTTAAKAKPKLAKTTKPTGADSIALHKAIESVANNVFQYTCWKHDYPNATKAKAFAAKSERALVKLRSLITKGWSEPSIAALPDQYDKLYFDVQGSGAAYTRSIKRTQSHVRFFEQKRAPETFAEYMKT